MRGDGLFELFSVYSNSSNKGFIRSNILEMHLERLSNSSKTLNIKLPDID